MDPKPTPPSTNISAFLADQERKMAEVRRKFAEEQNRQAEESGAEIRSFAERTHSKTKELARIKKRLAETMQALTDIKEWETKNEENPDTAKLKEDLYRVSNEQAAEQGRLWAEIEEDKTHKYYNASSPVKPELMDKINQVQTAENRQLAQEALAAIEQLITSAGFDYPPTWQNVLNTTWARENDLAGKMKKKNALQLKSFIATAVSQKISELEKHKPNDEATLPTLKAKDGFNLFPLELRRAFDLSSSGLLTNLKEGAKATERMNKYVSEIKEELRRLRTHFTAWEKTAGESNPFTRTFSRSKNDAYESAARNLRRAAENAALNWNNYPAGGMGQIAGIYSSLSDALAAKNTKKIKEKFAAIEEKFEEHIDKLEATKNELATFITPRLEKFEAKKNEYDTAHKRWSEILRSVNSSWII